MFGGPYAFGDLDGQENDEACSEEAGEQGQGLGVADPGFDLAEGEDAYCAGEFVGHSPEAEELADPCGRSEEADHCPAGGADASEADADAIADDPEDPLVGAAGKACDFGGKEGAGAEDPYKEEDADGGFDADAVLVAGDDDGGDACGDGDLEGEDKEAHFFDAKVVGEDGGEGDHGLDAQAIDEEGDEEASELVEVGGLFEGGDEAGDGEFEAVG